MTVAHRPSQSTAPPDHGDEPGRGHDASALLAALPDVALVITKNDRIGCVRVPEDQVGLFGGLEVGQSLATARWPRDLTDALVASIDEVRRDGTRVDFDVELDTDDGRHLHRIHLAPLGEDVLCVVRDDDAIVERRMGRDREMVRLARAVDAYLWSATVSTDGVFRYRYYSPTVEKLTGYPVEHFMGGIERWLQIVHPDDRPRLEEAAGAAIVGQQDRLVREYRVIRPDGSIVWLRDHALVDSRPDGSRLLTGFVLDVTSRRKLEAQFLEAQKAETVSMLAGGIAHDFNNILTSILGGAHVALGAFTADGRTRTALELVVDGAQRASALCRQLLAYAGKAGTLTEPVSMSALLTEMRPMLQTLAGSAALELEVPEEDAVVVADRTQLQQLVLNLVTNAADAVGPDGTISVRVGQEWLVLDELPHVVMAEGAADGRHVVLEVKDDGVGMSPHTRERMFAPFFSTKQRGHGLGLAAALGIVQVHHGVVQVETAEGAGTSVRISLPHSNEMMASEPPSSERTSTIPPRKHRVLFVDDEEAIRRVVRMSLEQSGYQVVTAADGPSGLAYMDARGSDVSVLVLDMTMPGMSGEEVLRRVRQSRPTLSVLLCSGHAPSSVGDLIANDEHTHFLPKPYRVDELIAELATLLDGETEPTS